MLFFPKGTVAWWSTRISDRPAIRTVLVFERRTQQTPVAITEPRTNANEPTREEIEQNAILQNMDAPNIVNRRRLEYLDRRETSASKCQPSNFTYIYQMSSSK